MRSRLWPAVLTAALSAALPGRAPAQVVAPQQPAAAVAAPSLPVADPAQLAFEQGRWEDAIVQFRDFLAEYPEDRISLLRIAQAQRELGRFNEALATLEQARTANAPEAMIDFERARNLVLLGRPGDALAALDAADHSGLRALALLEQARELDSLRAERRFQSVYRSVRARVYPCEGLPEASAFDFWLGRWEVRLADGTPVGTNTISKRDGGCSIQEKWEGSGGSSGTSVSFYLPSRGEWRQVWTGSAGTLFDMTGKVVDGAMRMEGTIEYVEPNRVLAFRGTWTLSVDGRVRQHLEEFDLGAQTWVQWFDGFYRRLE